MELLTSRYWEWRRSAPILPASDLPALVEHTKRENEPLGEAPVKRRAGIWIAGVVGAGLYYACQPGTPRIAYINADRRLGPVVEDAARERGETVATALVPASNNDVSGRGDARDVGFAEAVVGAPDIVAVVGHPSSRASLLAAPIYGEAGVPFIVPTATSRRLRDAGPWTFQLAPDDEAEGAFIAGFALDSLKARGISIFYLVADEYGIGLRGGIARALAARGVAPADAVGILEDSDFGRRVAASLRRQTPDAVVIAARTPEAVGITLAIRKRLPGVPLILADGVEPDAFVHAVASRLGPADAVAWWRADNPDPASQAFVQRFERAAGRAPRPQEAMYYDALMVAAQAVETVGPRRDAVRRYLTQLGVSRPAYAGITGPISFTRSRPTNLVMVRLRAAPAAGGR